MKLDDTLKDRNQQYGNFYEQAKSAREIKKAFAKGANWTVMEDDFIEALEIIAVKISRILTGNTHNYDSWHDIAGYAELVARRIKPEEKILLTSRPFSATMQEQ
jgi:ppGpp synthetase/RelA/SpoT-type nucleotidyltranferase